VEVPEAVLAVLKKKKVGIVEWGKRKENNRKPKKAVEKKKQPSKGKKMGVLQYSKRSDQSSRQYL